MQFKCTQTTTAGIGAINFFIVCALPEVPSLFAVVSPLQKYPQFTTDDKRLQETLSNTIIPISGTSEELICVTPSEIISKCVFMSFPHAVYVATLPNNLHCD